ncbi:MAG: hypothetical protein ABSH51_13135 [Solirubrobacteraceae bacterium]|jgi:hypothetical protein
MTRSGRGFAGARRPWTRLAAAALVAASACVPAPAASSTAPAPPACAPSAESSIAFAEGPGVRVLSETDVPVCTTGAVTIQFRGTRSAGCAAAGLCGYAGTDSWEPGGADLIVLRISDHGRRRTVGELAFNGDHPVVSRVVEAGRRATTGCTDARSSLTEAGNVPTLGAPARAVVTIRPLGGNGLLPTRCAGPLGADVARAGPVASLVVSRALAGATTTSLVGDRPFAGHGFTGTVDSTVVMTTGSPGPPIPGVRAPARHRIVEHEVTLTYRITALTGGIVARWQGPRLPGCAALGACDSAGTVRIAPRATRGESVRLVAYASARRSFTDLLSALGVSGGGDPRGVPVAGYGIWPARGAVSATFRQRGGRCAGTSALTSSLLTLSTRAGRLTIAYQPVSQADDVLRTRCPGPDLGNGAAASVTVPVLINRQRAFTLRLDTPEVLRDAGYRIRLTPDLRLTLARTAIVRQAV